jgi:hypothetical protein
VIPVLWRHFALEAAMMGRQSDDQGHLFYDFCLAEAVPDDHPVRKIDAIVDLSWVYGELAPYYPTLGRPSVDPVLMLRMLIIGYVFGLRSERLLCREVQVNFAYRWFCIRRGMGTHPPLPLGARPRRLQARIWISAFQ